MLECYYDYRSPFPYLALEPVAALGRRYAVAVDWIPIRLPDLTSYRERPMGHNFPKRKMNVMSCIVIIGPGYDMGDCQALRPSRFRASRVVQKIDRKAGPGPEPSTSGDDCWAFVVALKTWNLLKL